MSPQVEAEAHQPVLVGDDQAGDLPAHHPIDQP
jgi:hypothetical protein